MPKGHPDQPVPIKTKEAVRESAAARGIVPETSNTVPTPRRPQAPAAPSIKTKDSYIRAQPDRPLPPTQRTEVQGQRHLSQERGREAARKGAELRRAEALPPTPQTGQSAPAPIAHKGGAPAAPAAERLGRSVSASPPAPCPAIPKQVGGAVTVKEKVVRSAKPKVSRPRPVRPGRMVKTAEAAGRQTVKLSERSYQAAAHTAQSAKVTMEAGRQLTTFRQKTKQAQAAAKKAAQAAGRVLRAMADAARMAVMAMLSGGGLVLAIVLVICIIGLILSSPFAIFFAIFGGGGGQAQATYSMQDAVAILNEEFTDRIEQIKADNPHDTLDMDNAGSAAMIANWDDVLAVYAVRTSTDPDNPQEVATVNEDKLSILREIFWAMNEVSCSTETVTHSSSHTNEDGEVVETTSTETILHITVTTKDHLQMADEYGFTEEQRAFLEELLQPEYQELFMMLTGSYQDLTLSQAEIADIMARLPADLSEERKQIVLNAYKLVGKVHYFWGGKSTAIGWDSRWGTPMEVTAAGDSSTGTMRPFGLDCTGFIDWVLRNAGLPSDGHWYIGTNLTEVSQAEALPGDIALNADASHVGIVVGRDEDGKLLVCHCSYGQDNVVVTGFGASGFAGIGRLELV